jgi:hypothetical protein
MGPEPGMGPANFGLRMYLIGGLITLHYLIDGNVYAHTYIYICVYVYMYTCILICRYQVYTCVFNIYKEISEVIMIYNRTLPSLSAQREGLVISEENQRRTAFPDKSLNNIRWGNIGGMGRRLLPAPYVALIQVCLLI